MTKRHWYLLGFSLATLAWIAFIFGNSMQSGTESGAASGAVTEWINDMIGNLIPSFEISGYLIRKLAHFGEFALLSLLFSLDLTLLLSLRQAPSVRRKALVLLAVPASAAVASIDEAVIQRMTAGRVPSVTDVFIDTAGAAFACLIVFGILAWMTYKERKKAQKPLS